MTTRSRVYAAFEHVATTQKKTLAPLTDDLVLLDCGLDSLCFALVVAHLEDEFGADPFTASDDMVFPVTLGDFVKLYETVDTTHAAA
jgi:acyl carrier protein